MKTLPIYLVLVLPLFLPGCRSHGRSLILASEGRTAYVISLTEDATATVRFAAEELATYLERITGAEFPLVYGPRPDGSRPDDSRPDGSRPDSPSIFLAVEGNSAAEARGVRDRTADAYSIESDSRNIWLKGRSDRAVLFAAYDLLEMLGCRFLAPEFDFYGGFAEIVPGASGLTLAANLSIIREPVFRRRKLDLAEGRSLDSASLSRIIDWMPKNRFNTLMIPVNQNHSGRIVWDEYRFLTPEIRKRGIILEVGQHGYQNFLNAGMEGGKLFRDHPEWFGKDENGLPSRSMNTVFNTSDREAVEYFTASLLAYIEDHREIDVFDLWPPDMAEWYRAGETAPMSPAGIQAGLAGQVYDAFRKAVPGTGLEVIAFASALDPVDINENILVDICPINQNFEKQIFDPASPRNRIYADALTEWRKAFGGELGIYAYYRKYAWKSLPNLIPHYMQADLQWYAGIPVQGISCYAEKGDWYTYELNHYVLGKLEWDPWISVDSLILSFCKARYGPAAETAAAAFTCLEETVRFCGNIANSGLKSAETIRNAGKRIRTHIRNVKFAQTQVNFVVKDNLSNLILMLKYAELDLEIQEIRASGGSSAPEAQDLLNRLIQFRSANEERGVFIYSENEDMRYLSRHYGLEN